MSFRLPNIDQLVSVYERKGYKMYSLFHKYDLNIFGIRVDTSNEFNDYIGVLYGDKNGKARVEWFSATTNSGTYWLLKPLVKGGTAVLLPGFYRSVYKLGKHKGYEALEQIGKMKYIRDNNRNSTIEFSGKGISKPFWANLKTNIHRAAESGWSKFVNKWSAGCQVITGKHLLYAYTNWGRFMWLAKQQKKHGYGNRYSYALFTIKDFQHLQ